MQGYYAVGMILLGLLVWDVEKVYAKRVRSTENFDWATANTSVWLSAAAYCETETYLTREYKGYSRGFIPMHTVVSKKYDVQVGTNTRVFLIRSTPHSLKSSIDFQRACSSAAVAVSKGILLVMLFFMHIGLHWSHAQPASHIRGVPRLLFPRGLHR